MNAEALARLFHETYERLAPDHGYRTREASAVPWADVPSANKSLMIAVAGEVRQALGLSGGATTLWEVLHVSQRGGYVVFSFVVRAATAEAAIALTKPWEAHTATAEPLTYEGEPEVIVSDAR